KHRRDASVILDGVHRATEQISDAHRVAQRVRKALDGQGKGAGHLSQQLVAEGEIRGVDPGARRSLHRLGPKAGTVNQSSQGPTPVPRSLRELKLVVVSS